MGGPDVGLEFLPAQRADGVAEVDGEDGEEEIEIVYVFESVPEFVGVEAAEIEGVAGAIEEIGDEGDEREEVPLAGFCRHERADYVGMRVASRREGRSEVRKEECLCRPSGLFRRRRD